MSGVVSLKGERGLWFLSGGGAGGWKLIGAAPGSPPFMAAYFPLPTDGGPSIFDSAAATSVHDRVAAELAQAALRANNTNSLHLSAEGLLRAENTPFVAGLFRKLSLSDSADLKGLALARALNLNDSDALVQLADNPGSVLKSRYRTEISINLFSWRGGDSRAVRALGKIATAQGDFGPLRYSVANALRAVHTREAVPALVALLDDPDKNIREQAIRGLSHFVENVPVITPEANLRMEWATPGPSTTYRDADTDRFSGSMRVPPEREAEYVAFWKSWWAENRTKLGFQ